MPEDMSAERPLGQPEKTIEERQVAVALVKARAQRPGLYPMSGGADVLDMEGLPDVSKTRGFSPEDRERREREERLRGVYTGLAETLQRTSDPEAMTILVRSELASVEAVPEAPELEWIKYPQRELRGKANNCGMALKFGDNPRLAKGLGLEEKRLIPRVVERPALRDTGHRYEMFLEQGEAVMLRAAVKQTRLGELAYLYERGGKWRVSLSPNEYETLRKNPDMDEKIFQKTERVVEPPLYSQDELKRIKETSEKLHKEILVRTKLMIAWYLYRYGNPPGFTSLSALAKLGGQYSGISNEEFQSLFSSEATTEGEVWFGDKIDLAMRLYCLIAMANKADRNKSSSEEDASRADLVRREFAKQPPGLSQHKDKDGLIKKILELGAKNVFCQRVEGGDPATEIVNWTKTVIGGDLNENAAAVELGRRLFFIFGIAGHLDYRKGKGPSGPANTDATATIQHFESWRGDQAKKKYPHGSEATLGKYPETLISSFFHSTFFYQNRSQKILEGKTLWEMWWDEGKTLKELPWGELAQGSWFSYNFGLSNLGKEKAVFDMMMEPLSMRELMRIKPLQELKRSIDRGVTEVTILGPEKKDWIDRIRKEIKALQEDGYEVNIKEKPEDFTPKELGELLKVKRRQIFDLILTGAIVENYRDAPGEAVKTIGFLYTGQETPQIEDGKTVFLSLMARVGCDAKKVLKRAKGFLDGIGYKTGAINI